MADDYRLGSQDKLNIRIAEWQTVEGTFRDWSAVNGEYSVGPGRQRSRCLSSANCRPPARPRRRSRPPISEALQRKLALVGQAGSLGGNGAVPAVLHFGRSAVAWPVSLCARTDGAQGDQRCRRHKAQHRSRPPARQGPGHRQGQFRHLRRPARSADRQACPHRCRSGRQGELRRAEGGRGRSAVAGHRRRRDDHPDLRPEGAEAEAAGARRFEGRFAVRNRSRCRRRSSTSRSRSTWHSSSSATSARWRKRAWSPIRDCWIRSNPSPTCKARSWTTRRPSSPPSSRSARRRRMRSMPRIP